MKKKLRTAQAEFVEEVEDWMTFENWKVTLEKLKSSEQKIVEDVHLINSKHSNKKQ
jgi:hypothetical protein